MLANMTQIGSITPSLSYLALMGDLVGSREVPDRAGLQRRLTELLSDLNERYRPWLEAPLRVVRGDEFQGLFRAPHLLIPVITTIEDRMHPVRVTFGAGWGALSTDPGSDVGALDGPAFHRCRDALEEARRQGEWARTRGLGTSLDALVTAHLSLLAAVRSRWTDTQRGYVRAARSSLQREVAEAYGVSESTVSKSLSAARFPVVLAGEHALTNFLQEMELPLMGRLPATGDLS
jgi:hypothetical protein